MNTWTLRPKVSLAVSDEAASGRRPGTRPGSMSTFRRRATPLLLRTAYATVRPACRGPGSRLPRASGAGGIRWAPRRARVAVRREDSASGRESPPARTSSPAAWPSATTAATSQAGDTCGSNSPAFWPRSIRRVSRAVTGSWRARSSSGGVATASVRRTRRVSAPSRCADAVSEGPPRPGAAGPGRRARAPPRPRRPGRPSGRRARRTAPRPPPPVRRRRAACRRTRPAA